ncbi:cation:proton antiporter [Candidatus Gracilibacteria bacterium 28_42_T64]|nr:cation:proton antiporter [Candidatus Gracilibacteria bacterium 28_42_T64]
MIAIIVLSKIIAHGLKIVDVLVYIILGFIITKLDILPRESEVFAFLSEIGVIFLMFYAGWMENSKTFFKKVIENKWVAIIGAIGPFLGAYLGISFLGFTFHEAIVAGFIFTATAVPFTIAILQSLKLQNTPGAKSIVAAAMADGFISIITMSAVFSTFVLYQSGGVVDMSSIIFETLGKLFLLFLCFGVFYILAVIIFPSEHSQVRMNDTLAKSVGKTSTTFFKLIGLKWFTKKFHKVEIMIPTTLFLIFSLSIFSHVMGLHVAIGAYLTGLILHVDMFYSPDKYKKSDELPHDEVETNYKSLTGVMYSLANHFLGPIFFIYLGSKLIIDGQNISEIFSSAFVLFIFIAVFQFISASFAARYTAKLSFNDSVLVGFGMWPRDVLAFVILGVGISAGLIEESSTFISVIVVTILLLDISAPIAIKWWAKRYKNI